MSKSPRFQKDGPKRRRRTRRELPYGQISLWGKCVINFKAEREAAYLQAREEDYR